MPLITMTMMIIYDDYIAGHDDNYDQILGHDTNDDTNWQGWYHCT